MATAVITGRSKASTDGATASGSGATTARRPSTPRMLKVLLPTTLPTAMSRSPRIVAMTDVATSGSEVPAATMVSPIDEFGDAERPARTRPPPSTSQARAEHQQREAGERPAAPGSAQCRVPAGAGAPNSSAYSAFVRLRLAPRLHDQERRVGDDQREQQRAVEAADAAVEASAPEQQRGADHDRHLLPDELRVDDQRRDQRRHAEDEQHVEDVAADDVADGDVGLAGQRRAARTPPSPARWCRRRRSVRPTTSGEMPNDSGDPRRAADEQLGADDEQRRDRGRTGELYEHDGDDQEGRARSPPGTRPPSAAGNAGVALTDRVWGVLGFNRRAGCARGTVRARRARSSARCRRCATGPEIMLIARGSAPRSARISANASSMPGDDAVRAHDGDVRVGQQRRRGRRVGARTAPPACRSRRSRRTRR